jgi:predicted PurR-regulated permease PerM
MKQAKSILNGNYNAFFRQLFFFLALILIAVVIWKQLSFFMSCFLGATTLYVVLRTPLFFLAEKKRWRPWLASLTLVSGISLLLLVIGFFVFQIVAPQLTAIDILSVENGIRKYLNSFSHYINHPILPEDIFAHSKGFITGLLSGIFNTAYSFVVNLFMMVVVLYFMLSKGRQMEKAILEYLPLNTKSISLIKTEVKSMIYSNAVGLPVIMLAQTIVSGLGYWIFGVDNFLFWAFLTAIVGLIPVVGTAGVWLPVAISLLLNNELWYGIGLIVYGVLIITNTDNVCRLVLMKKMADTHPLIVIFGVILGIPLFGFWGIIFGPLLISGFLLLIKIYTMEYSNGGKTKIEREITQD